MTIETRDLKHVSVVKISGRVDGYGSRGEQGAGAGSIGRQIGGESCWIY